VVQDDRGCVLFTPAVHVSSCGQGELRRVHRKGWITPSRMVQIDGGKSKSPSVLFGRMG
jgi:hypothetical protein